jgi:hypothetical protein
MSENHLMLRFSNMHKLSFTNKTLYIKKEVVIIKNTYDDRRNEYEVKENIAFLKLRKKNGTLIDCKIDIHDLERVLEGGLWFAEWHKDFNNYLALRYIQKEKRREKQALHSFIIGADDKAPVRHLNGDTLDNRKSNLEIYNRNTPNDYKQGGDDSISIILRDNHGRENGKTIIDRDDLSRVLNNGYTWVHYRKDERRYAVANTPSGRIFLEKFIMNAPENVTVHHKNHNTLDNRKINLENVEEHVGVNDSGV